MPSDFPTPGTRKYRSNLDLVATDEMLAMLQRGLARLRNELEAEQKKQAETRAMGTFQPWAAAGAATSLETVSAVDDRIWFYADDMSGAALAGALAD